MDPTGHPPDPGELAAHSAPYVLLDAHRRRYPSSTAGRFGGQCKNRIYGRVDCRAALAAISKGGYVAHRVFFVDEPTAVAAGYRPCAACVPEPYRGWKGR